jgi:hypothetical protein
MENRPAETQAENLDVVPHEKLNTGSRAAPGSAAGISPAVAPKCKQDFEKTRDIEKGEGGLKLEETSSTESPPQHGAINEYNEDGVYEPGLASRFWRKYRPFGHAIIWLLATAYASR